MCINSYIKPFSTMRIFKGYKNDGNLHQVTSTRKISSSSPINRKPRLTFAIKDFMESETFKVLMQKRSQQNEKSKETNKNDDDSHK